MKVAIFNPTQARELRAKGRKTRSHGTFRAKRKPHSKRVAVNAFDNPQYRVAR